MSTHVEFYWRPGCPFCSRLRGDLRRVGLPLREINIWERPAAAATVRAVAGGNETVPTVVVGEKAMVNPTAGQVLDAVRAQAPELLDEVDGDAVTRLAQGAWWGGAVLSVVVAVAWFLLATAHPATTYHFAPMLVAAAWPVTRRWRTRTVLPGRVAVRTALGGATVAMVITALLAVRHALAGPTLLGTGGALTETLIAVAMGAVFGGVLAVTGRRKAGQ
ncbi:glutaredoxin family protein [Amycolatopsis echigonensis]|uniref:Glutaredoxin n=1 Tax=Amycolatopsis echigonensis TaxID=2576905 RepID=A0A8E2B7L3_9PSEU|nr:glutaredoxin domain-containing protein [Amycolatopsis echigonensis]MBB2504031.1 glutaredoxin [Amycolatopsis echigonensis]